LVKYPDNERRSRNFLSYQPEGMEAVVAKNHAKKNSVWLIYYKKGTGKTSMDWSDAVDEALCFGWIDSKRKSIDDENLCSFLASEKQIAAGRKLIRKKLNG